MQMKRSPGPQIDRRSLVETASAMVDIPSPTGSEQAMAEHLDRMPPESRNTASVPPAASTVS